MRKDYRTIYKYDLPHRAVVVYIYLLERCNPEGVCWPSQGTIAKELKVSRMTVIRAIDDLKKAGLVETKQRFRSHGEKSSLQYHLKI